MLGLWNSKKTILESGILKGATDNHSHILYGVDDGVKTVEDSLRILGFLEEAGVETLWLTPHIMEDVPNTSEALKARFSELKKVYNGHIQLHLAAEYMMDTLYEQRLHDRDLRLHGGDRVLIETSAVAPPVGFWDIVSDTMKSGYRPILAHPERYVYMSPSDYDRLHKMGVLLQLNLPSLAGVYGEHVKIRAMDLLNKGYYCMWGSDCHRFRAIEGQYNAKFLKSGVIEMLEKIKTGDNF
ncbi:MAG: capsular biosynthesis protein [Bacteroidales bacterium]|nr:capsular biosynthesis protein [Bacteroidales bacterium]